MRGIDMKHCNIAKKPYRIVPLWPVLAVLVFCSLLPTTVCAKTPGWISQLVFPAPRQVSTPASLALDIQRQRYYVVDSQAGRLLSFDKSGIFLSEFDAAGGLTCPTTMTFAQPGKMWLIERANNSLLYIDMTTQKIRAFFPTGTDGKQLFPDHIATDEAHRLYISDRRSGRIYALDDDLNIATVFAPQAGGQLIDFKIKGKQLWALDRVQHVVYCFSLDGSRQRRIVLEHSLDFPVSLEIDPQQHIYILDRAAAKIYRFTTNGKYMEDFGQKGYRRGQLNYPSQLVLDWQQRLCVVNQGNGRIEVFSH